MNLDSKKWWEEKLFLRNQSIKVIYPNEENEFMVPNHEIKRDYYVNPCLCQLRKKFNSEKCWKESFSYVTKVSLSLIPMSKMSLWHPIMKRKKITM